MTDWAFKIVERLLLSGDVLSRVGIIGSEPSIFMEVDLTPDNIDIATNGPIVIVRQVPFGQSEIGRVLDVDGIKGTWSLSFQIRLYGVEDQDVHGASLAAANALGGWRSGDVEGCEVSFPVGTPTSSPSIIGRTFTAQMTVREN